MARQVTYRPKGFMRRQLKAHARILAAVVIGVIVWLVASNFLPATRFLIAWNVAVWLFLALILKMMGTASVADLRKRAGLEEEGRFARCAAQQWRRECSRFSLIRRLSH